ncbi:MAG TPA: DNA polymerase III subunit delta [Devosia sp.]|jgi:DNA polymerase-3 subunit delta|uniref:DNA polymerase III subunit delta n=1 Tax=Devosia sp. TaxID=1871048 RepID=UPI002DDD4468|nr:DNA polymerase III subunit delta [Devosia sp.]HEV2513923.1 DNA polymerase III subunit delta [Devosia sp.]
MGALKAHEVSRFVDRPDLEAGIILAYGPDTGLVRETGQRLARRYAGNDADSMNLVVLDGSELDADPSRLAVEAKTTSLFGDRRVIRVRGAGKSLVMPLTELRDDPGSIIILEAGNLTPKDPLRALVEAAKLGRALPCYPDNDESLGRLISETFSKAGIRADQDTVAAIRDNLGNDREITRRELEKLVLFAADTKLLTREDVLTLCADNAALVLDEVVDATGTGHAANLDTALERAIAQSVNSQQILASALGHFTTLRRWRVEVDAGKSPGAVLDNARPKPHFSRRSSIERQLRLWTDDALSAALDRLQLAVADSRKRYGLADTISRRALLAVCTMAAER